MDNAFDQLEDRVKKAADVVKRLRQENKALQEELAGKGASEEETRRADELAREVKGLRGERDEIRRRIAKLVQVLDALDPAE